MFFECRKYGWQMCITLGLSCENSAVWMNGNCICNTTFRPKYFWSVCLFGDGAELTGKHLSRTWVSHFWWFNGRSILRLEMLQKWCYHLSDLPECCFMHLIGLQYAMHHTVYTLIMSENLSFCSYAYEILNVTCAKYDILDICRIVAPTLYLPLIWRKMWIPWKQSLHWGNNSTDHQMFVSLGNCGFSETWTLGVLCFILMFLVWERLRWSVWEFYF